MTCLVLVFVMFTQSCSNSSPPPISVDKLTVVIVEETEKRQSLPPSQLSAITSQVWRDYVSEQQGQWRVLDPDTDISQEKEWVKKSMAINRGSVPWLIVATPTRGYSGPLPHNLDALMEIIKK